MPIYEYKCASCGHYLDVLQKLKDEPLRQCPECNENALRRLISAPSFRLKGGGWYETDFKSDKERKRNLAVGEADKKTDADKPKDDGKSSSSPEAKSTDGKSSQASSDASGGSASSKKTAAKSTGSEAA